MKKYIFIVSFLLLCWRLNATPITGYEYWFDSDTSNKVTVMTTDTSITIETIYSGLDVSSMNRGLHFLYVQFKNSEENVGDVQSMYFIIPDSPPWTNPDNRITGYEYWLDNQFNERTIIPVDNLESFTITTDIDYSSLNRGIHFFHIRFRDSEGKWSCVQSNYFVIPDNVLPWTNPNNVLTEYQYWIDSHFDQIVSGTIDNLSSFNITTDVDYSYLNRGLHFFHIRFKDSEGKWSCVQSNYFIIPDVLPWTNESNVLNEYEYWLDNQYEQKVSGTTNNVKSFTISENIDYSTLNRGLHFFHIRFKDSESKWSCVQSNYFIIPDIEPWSNLNNKIIAYKYWYDDNTAGTELITLQEPVNPYELNTAFTVPNFSEGTTHSFNIQFMDLEGMWSSVITSEFTFNNSIPVADAGLSDEYVYLGQSVELTGSTTDPNNDPITAYEWVIVSTPVGSTLGGTTVSTSDFNFTPDVVGDYQISFRASDGLAWSDADYVTVHVAENQVPVAVISADVTSGKAPLTVNFDGSQCSDPENVQLQYEWDFGDGSPVSNEISPAHIYNTPGIYNVTVKVSDGFNPPVESNITITVLIPNYPPIAICKDVTVYANATQCMANASIDNGSSDPDNDEITITQEPPGPYPLGNSTVSLTVTDEHGLSSSCNANVNVIDNTPPVVLTKNPTVTLVKGTASITIDDVDNGSYDNCGIAEMSLSKSTFDCSDGGRTVDVILTVTDVNGNTATGTSIVSVIGEIPSIGISVYPPYTVPGEDKNTIYLGYGYQSVTLTASGGTNYSWTSDPPGFTSNVANPTVSPTDTTTYTVTVTNDYGCTGTMSITVIVVDWRCGNGDHKVKVCHNGKTICIDTHAVQLHLEHGDYLGDCNPNNGHDNGDINPDPPNNDNISVRLKQNNPNPFATTTEIQYFVSQQAHATIVLTDIEGSEIARLIDMTVKAGWSSLIMNGSNLSAGTYYLRLESMGKVDILGITKY